MDWFVLSLLGAAAFAATGIIDKLLLGRFVQKPLAYLAALVIMQQALIPAIPFYLGWGWLFPQALYALATGAFQVILWAAYLRALQKEETSRIAALIYIFPIFVFLGSFLFLGESLHGDDYLGGSLLVCSAVLISYRPGQQASLSISPVLKHMAVFWFFTAAYALASKYLLGFMTEWHLILWSSLGSFLAILPILWHKEMRRECKAYVRGGAFLFLALFANEILDFLGRGAFIFAYAQGSVALVSSLAALQPFITLLYVILLGRFFPGVLVEEMDRKALVIKVAAVLLIVAGVYLVS
ncbi:MAG: EamA family transporter [Methanothrix sp.]|nr:EamA family transporter [Methanothrix sp.]